MYTNPTIHNLFYAYMQFQLFILHAGQYTNPTIHHSFRGAREASTQIPIQINRSFMQMHTHHSSLIQSNAHPTIHIFIGQYTDPTIQNSFKPIKNPMIQHSFRPHKYTTSSDSVQYTETKRANNQSGEYTNPVQHSLSLVHSFNHSSFNRANTQI